jgi:hypothetical protein
MNRKLIGAMFAALAVVACVPQVQAGLIPVSVPDYSFEDTSAAASPYYVQMPNNGDPASGTPWVTGPGPGNGYTDLWIRRGDIGWDFTNVDGNQVAAAYSLSGDSLWTAQLLTTTYEAGKTYDLTMACGRNYTPVGSTVYVELGYKDESGNLQSIGGAAHNAFSEDTLPLGTLPASAALVDKVATVAVGASDAWAGKQILIRFGFDGPSGDNRLVVDNVRCGMTPEPSGIVLLALGLAGLLAYAWRKRR